MRCIALSVDLLTSCHEYSRQERSGAEEFKYLGKTSLTCCQSNQRPAVFGSFTLPLDCVTWLRCGIDFCEGLEENHISFYWLESYINCIMKNTVGAFERNLFQAE